MIQKKKKGNIHESPEQQDGIRDRYGREKKKLKCPSVASHAPPGTIVTSHEPPGLCSMCNAYGKFCGEELRKSVASCESPATQGTWRYATSREKMYVQQKQEQDAENNLNLMIQQRESRAEQQRESRAKKNHYFGKAVKHVKDRDCPWPELEHELGWTKENMEGSTMYYCPSVGSRRLDKGQMGCTKFNTIDEIKDILDDIDPRKSGKVDDMDGDSSSPPGPPYDGKFENSFAPPPPPGSSSTGKIFFSF